MSKILVLQTEEKKHIGFLMFAGDGNPFSDQNWKGDCIFTGVPNDTEIFDHALCHFIYDTKHKEFNANITNIGDYHKVVINSADTAIVQAEISENHTGFWQVNVGKAAGMKGVCIIPPPKKTAP